MVLKDKMLNVKNVINLFYWNLILSWNEIELFRQGWELQYPLNGVFEIIEISKFVNEFLKLFISFLIDGFDFLKELLQNWKDKLIIFIYSNKSSKSDFKQKSLIPYNNKILS